MTHAPPRLRSLLTDERVILVAIVLLAIAVRAAAVGSDLSVDDGYSWLVGSAPSAHTFLARLAGSENTPPLFYLLLEPLPIHHPAWLRLPAALPGVLACPVLYFALRRPLGAAAALLAALAVAVSPFLVTYANLTRGFMLEDLVLLVALGAMLRLAERESRRWWAVYLLAGVVAIYTEYDSAIFLLALTGALLLARAPIGRRRLALLGPAPLLAILPWIPQIVRAQDAVNKTKVTPSFPGPSLTALRDLIVTLAFGENGGTLSSVGRWLELAAIVALGGLAAVILRRQLRVTDAPPARATTVKVLALLVALTLIGHALATPLGVHVFEQRYLTILIPLVAALGAGAIVAARRRSLLALAAVALVALGVANFARRVGHQFAPSLTAVRSAALALHARSVLTNNPVVLYYLPSLHPRLDRPFNLGPGDQNSCARPCLVIDDMTVRTGPPRALSTPGRQVGVFRLTLSR